MDTALWQRSTKLLKQVVPMPVQARGRTKVATNLRVEPGRTQARLYQFGRGVPVEIVGRAVADWVQVTDEKEGANEPQDTKKEDWFLIRGLATRPPGESTARVADTNTTTQPGDQTLPIAGWVIARFIELDLPDPVRDGAYSANIRPIAWFELNRVSDPSGDKIQYLVAGAKGAEGQACDFTTLRVYTWNLKKERYETAFIENDLCGQLPIRVGRSAKRRAGISLSGHGRQQGRTCLSSDADCRPPHPREWRKCKKTGARKQTICKVVDFEEHVPMP